MVMLSNTPKIDSTHQDENDDMDAVDLYSCEKCYVSIPHAVAVMSTLIHYIITLRYAFGNLTTA